MKPKRTKQTQGELLLNLASSVKNEKASHCNSEEKVVSIIGNIEKHRAEETRALYERSFRMARDSRGF
jgi:hypothetical protein